MAEAGPPRAARELIPRLPRTFAPAFNERLNQWSLLFPAEQRQFASQVGWLAGLSESDFNKLFAPVLDVEKRMDLSHFTPGAKEISVQQTGVLARSPLYPQWRDEVARVFSQMDEGAATYDSPLTRIPRLIVAALPAGLPAPKEPLWTALAKEGAWVELEKPWSTLAPGLLDDLLKREPPAGLEGIETSWILETESRFGPGDESTTVLSWTGLEPVRREFLARLNRIRRDLKSVDDTNEELKRLDLRKIAGQALGSRPRLLEFVRTLLLSGNGSLVFPNSFVQWGAAEALRRAQPQFLLAAFGLRQKLKPFSSTVLFEDQNRSNPTADEDDPAGSLVDGALLAEYVHLAAQRVPAFEGRTVTVMALGDWPRILVLGAKSVPGGKWSSQTLSSFVRGWLQGKA